MAILRKGGIIGVCVHHAVYKPANNITELKAQAKLFDGWHKSKSWAEEIKTKGEFGFPYIEYHYLMATDGSILQVQDEKYVLYHAGDSFREDLSFNLHGIAICLTGNYENDIPTEAQMKALVLFIRDVEKRYKIDAMVRGHKETSKDPTACPGKNIETSKSGWLKQVIANVNNKDYPPKPPVASPEDPQITELKKQVTDLNKSIDSYKASIKELETQKNTLSKENKKLTSNIISLEAELEEEKKELKESEDKYATLMIEKNTIANTNADLVKELNELKSGRFMWLVEFLEKVVPKKSE